MTNKIIVTTEKTEDYKKYLKDNITKAYKKSTTSKISRVNLDSKKIANKLLISHRFDQLQKHDKHIMVKDHKESFMIHYFDLPIHKSQILVKLAKFLD